MFRELIVVTIPAYNEERTIGRVIEDIKKAMYENNYNYKILVVNDGSRDKTVEIAESKGAVVFSHSTDADGQYPSFYIPILIKKIQEGYDLVLGSRFGQGKYSGSFMKKLGNVAFAKVFSSLLKTKLRDTTTGFRAFRKEVAELPVINNFTYTQEQLIRAGKAKMRITEVPITTNMTRKSRLFKNSFDYALKAWVNILRIYRDFEPLKFFGSIGLIFILFGLIIGLRLLYFFITSGKVGHIPSQVLTMLLIIVGVQIVLFGFFADSIRK